MVAEQEVILVNEQDEQVGVMGKMQVHREGILHRAFSVFIFNSSGQMLLQQRAFHKYHSGGLWTNACCSHPAPGEITAQAAARRLKEEMGFDTPLVKIFDFIYRSEFGNGLTEHELDHVFAGRYDAVIKPDPAEVADHGFNSVARIQASMQARPGEYTSWFHIAFPKVVQWAQAQRWIPLVDEVL
jgi:isopentenyl-diphosphate delta-isomerase